MSTYNVAFWNVENLFDEEFSVHRTEKLKRALGRDLAGWTPQLRDAKIAQLASAISAMNQGAGPDLLGVCEVENAVVMTLLTQALRDRLPTRNYDFVHADTSDQRGIDVAFIFDADLFTAPLDQRFHHVVMRRTATRDILQVNFTTHRGRTWAVFANHWPSRSGGQYESAGYRAIAGETLAYFHERVREVHGKDTPVLVMGDFNDEPFDDSLVRHALSTRQAARVERGQNAYLLNLTWDLLGQQEGSFYFNNAPNMLDQFLVNAAMLEGDSPVRIQPGSVEMIRLPGMVRTGAYPTPIPFGGMGRPVNVNGYSDHSPIACTVTELD
ncbi:endonuclease/exonuclease/phosphatase [Nostocoides sp. F2B08]|uniref:endonuclease/exonuclease/phosphatase family protein n=1 Tax=Nostocoides sp. F2B08 TaxID=2653936 RepID=UPI001263022A|nr:endonuclease/exonuclease/phosphatase family protein [Tetrasphaera sp. F2B08]KAB7740335.1 endonuclease/exonuclease/phosphatase [Tetrasphaera sp. F2B08]